MTERSIHRYQRQRTKGWKMPPGVVYVGRGSKWGNPATPDVVRYHFGDIDERSAKFRAAIMFKHWLAGQIPANFNFGTPPTRDEIVAELRGKDLACWCKPDESCHADVLIWMANTDLPTRSRERLIEVMRTINEAVTGHPVAQWMREAAYALADPNLPADPHRGSMQWIIEGPNTQSAHVRELAAEALFYLEENAQ